MIAEKVTGISHDRAWLQFTSTPLGFDKFQVDYELIIPLIKEDCRGTFNHKASKQRPKSHRMVWLDSDNRRHIPLGRTEIGTSNSKYPFSKYEGSIDLPFRDGAHCQWDNLQLGGLSLYYQTSDGLFRLTRESDPKGSAK